MKKQLFLILVTALLAVTSSFAQTQELQIYRGGSLILSYPISSIDSLKVGYAFNAPDSVSAQLNGKTIAVSWTAVSGATSYQLYRSGDNKSYSLLAKDIKKTSYTDASPLTGTNYYKVKAIGQNIESVLSTASSPVSYNDDNNTVDISGYTGGVQTYTVNGVSFNMKKVEGGTFQMGRTLDSDEQPVHQVTVSSFSIGQTEVTQELWQAVMGSNPSNFKGSKRPVEMVSWNDCQTFITKLNQLTGKKFRLPTEAEWEYAAIGGNKSKGYTYSGSNTIGDVAWYFSNSNSTTHDVATKSPNELGLYDMSGNVWEWCQDWYGSYNSSSQTNPTGPTSGSNRMNRGGSWLSGAPNCRVALRGYAAPSDSNITIGFRLAQ